MSWGCGMYWKGALDGWARRFPSTSSSLTQKTVRISMPGRWKHRRVQTGRNTRRMTAEQRCASQYVSRSARNRPHGITLLAGTPRPAKSASDGFSQTGYIPCQYDVDLVIIGALWDRIHRHCRPAARTKHPTKLREAMCRLGEEHKPEIADHRVESFI